MQRRNGSTTRPLLSAAATPKLGDDMQTSTDYWLSRDEVADRLKLPIATIAQWASQKKGPPFAKIGRFARYKLSDLLAWEDAQATGGEAA